MTSKTSHTELETEYCERNVEQSLAIQSALTEAVENDKSIADAVLGAKALSEAWKTLTSIVEDEDCHSEITKCEKCGIYEIIHCQSKVSSLQSNLPRYRGYIARYEPSSFEWSPPRPCS